MPLLFRILAGPSLDQLTPIEHNSDKPLDVKSDAYEGRIAVYIKGLDNASRQAHESSYFSDKRRVNVTWSIQAQGRYSDMYSDMYTEPHITPVLVSQVDSCSPILRMMSCSATYLITL